MRRFFASFVLLLAGFCLDARDIDLRSLGAALDGKTKETALLQKAIDIVSGNGGGRVLVPSGILLTAPVELKSGVDLHISDGAVVLASPDVEDYVDRSNPRHVRTDALPRFRNVALIYADEAENISISGKGTIDGNGTRFVRAKTGDDWTGWWYERIVPNEKSVPRVVFFAGCRNVSVTDVTMTNQPSGWSYWIHDCDNVVFKGCRILADVHFPNNDGIHINSSRDVKISHCHIVTGDDSVVIRANNRSLKENKVCERVSVSDCYFRSWSSGVRIGWTNDGTIRNCSFDNIYMYDCSNAVSCFLPKMEAVEATNDYGREATLVENISFSNIRMDKIYGSAIYVCVADSERTRFAGFRNVTFSNIDCNCLALPYFCGRADTPIRDITFNNCRFSVCTPDGFPENPRRHGAVLRPSAGKCNSNVENLLFNNCNMSIPNNSNQ